jgi:hypothetical protein
MCAVVAGCRSYTAIAEWVTHASDEAAYMLGMHASGASAVGIDDPPTTTGI